MSDTTLTTTSETVNAIDTASINDICGSAIPAPAPKTDAEILQELLARMAPDALANGYVTAQAKLLADKKAKAEARAMRINAFLVEHNEILATQVSEITEFANEEKIQFAIRFDQSTKRYTITATEIPVVNARPAMAASTAQPEVSARRHVQTSKEPVSVDGEMWESYVAFTRAHYDMAQFRFADGSPKSINMRTWLQSMGHIVGPPTR